MSWADMAEEEEVASRTPGRGVHMHEKLSSPSRKRLVLLRHAKCLKKYFLPQEERLVKTFPTQLYFLSVLQIICLTVLHI